MTSTSLPIWLTDYVGIPFVPGGRERSEGLDCWGLVRDVFANQCGIDLPEYGEVSSTDLIAAARKVKSCYNERPWRMVIDPDRFDVAVMRLYTSNIPGHVGIMVSDRWLLHTEESCGACVVRLDHATVRERIIGFRRYEPS